MVKVTHEARSVTEDMPVVRFGTVKKFGTWPEAEEYVSNYITGTPGPALKRECKSKDPDVRAVVTVSDSLSTLRMDTFKIEQE